jgi:hypothetical protein
MANKYEKWVTERANALLNLYRNGRFPEHELFEDGVKELCTMLLSGCTRFPEVHPVFEPTQVFFVNAGGETPPGWYKVLHFDYHQTRMLIADHGEPDWWWMCERIVDGKEITICETDKFVNTKLEPPVVPCVACGCLDRGHTCCPPEED